MKADDRARSDMFHVKHCYIASAKRCRSVRALPRSENQQLLAQPLCLIPMLSEPTGSDSTDRQVEQCASLVRAPKSDLFGKELGAPTLGFVG